MKIVLRAGFDVFSGYGNDAIDMALALAKEGAQVTPMPTALLPGIPMKFAQMLTRDPTGPKDVLLNFAAPMDLQVPRDFGHLKKVAYTMWERTPIVDGDFGGPWLSPEDAQIVPEYDDEKVEGSRQGKRRLEGWDKVLVTCPMNVDAFRPVTPDETPIKVVPVGIDPERWTFQRRTAQGPVRFLMLGMANARKAPFVTLDAWRRFRLAHPEIEATLHVHSLGRTLHPKIVEVYPDVTLSEKALTHEALREMYWEHDVLISTSRGEGANKPAMEFLATGGVVAATDWSGHQNWLHRDYAVPLPGTLKPCPGAEWAQDFHVDESALDDALLALARRDYDIPRMGATAAQMVPSMMSWSVTAQNLLREIGQIL